MISILRLKTLPASISPVIIGASLAYAHASLHLSTTMICALTGILIQIGTNIANDYFDHQKGGDTPQRQGPIRASQTGEITQKTLKTAFTITFGLAFLCGLYLASIGGLPILAIAILSIACGLLYTATPFAMAYTGTSDFFSLVFFGPVAVGSTYFLNTLQLSNDILLYSLAPGLLSTAILTVNNLRDIPEDSKTGKRTLAVRLGARFAKKEYVFCILSASLIPLIAYVLYGTFFWTVTCISIFFIAIPLIKSVYHDRGHHLNVTLASTAKLLVIYTLLFSLGVILQ